MKHEVNQGSKFLNGVSDQKYKGQVDKQCKLQVIFKYLSFKGPGAYSLKPTFADVPKYLIPHP